MKKKHAQSNPISRYLQSDLFQGPLAPHQLLAQSQPLQLFLEVRDVLAELLLVRCAPERLEAFAQLRIRLVLLPDDAFELGDEGPGGGFALGFGFDLRLEVADYVAQHVDLFDGFLALRFYFLLSGLVLFDEAGHLAHLLLQVLDLREFEC